MDKGLGRRHSQTTDATKLCCVCSIGIKVLKTFGKIDFDIIIIIIIINLLGVARRWSGPIPCSFSVLLYGVNILLNYIHLYLP